MKLMTKIKKMFTRNSLISIGNSLYLNNVAYWTDWTVTKAVNEGYEKNTWAYVAIKTIATNASTCDWYVARDNERVLDHPLNKVLEFPNPHMPKKLFFELIITWLQLSGSAPILKVQDGSGKTGELWLLSPDKVVPIISKTHGVDGYRLLEQGGSTGHIYDPEEIIYIVYSNPSNPYDGIAPLKVAAKAVDTDVELQDLGKATAQSMGTSNGIITFESEDDSLDGEQLRDMREQLISTFQQNRRTGVPNLLGHSLKYTKMGQSQDEMQFLEMRKFSRDEILAAFGMLPQLLGADGSIKYDNFMSGQRIMWANKVIPDLTLIKTFFNHSFRGELEEGEVIVFDTSRIQALRKDEKETSEIVEKYWKTGIPMQQLNAKFELGLTEYEGWSLPFNGTQQSNITTTEKEDNGERLQPCTHETRADAFFEKEVTRIKKKFLSMLDDQNSDVIKAWGKSPQKTKRDIEKLIDSIINEYDDDMTLMIKEQTLKSIQNFAGHLDIVVRDDEYLAIETREIDPREAVELLGDKYYAAEMKEIQKYTSESVANTIVDGVKAGLSVNDMAVSIQLDNAFSDARALAIARTEAATNQSVASLANAKSMDAKFKTWHATSGARQLHGARSGMTVKIDRTFSGGMRFPGDPTGQAKDRINCRCFMSYHMKDPNKP